MNNCIHFTSIIKSLNKRLKQDINNKTDNNYFEFIYNNFPRFKFTYKFHNNNLINAGLTLNILKEKIYNYEYLYKDRMEIEDEHLKSAIGYAVEQGSLEMKDGEQTTNLIFAFAPIDSSFFTESFFNTIQSL